MNDHNAHQRHVDCLKNFIDSHQRLFILSGAGLSTDSGIPDYRDADGRWKGATPIQHWDFINQPAKRRRYWARSMAGWLPVTRAHPNDGHKALARLENQNRVSMLVTQNVDGLHRAAGSHDLVELHGRLDRVLCLHCNTRLTRAHMQDKLVQLNQDWLADSGTLRPDGDIELGAVNYDAFRVPECPVCGGVLKPDVVFFGGTVPKSRVDRAWRGLKSANAMLVTGSSLMVWSGFRFARAAAAAGKPLMIINQGRTRADDLATCKLTDDCSRLLAKAIG